MSLKTLSAGFIFLCGLYVLVVDEIPFQPHKSQAHSDESQVFSSFSNFNEMVDQLHTSSSFYERLWLKLQMTELDLVELPKIKRVGEQFLIGDKKPIRLNTLGDKGRVYSVNGVVIKVFDDDRFVDVFKRVQKILEVRSPGPYEISDPRQEAKEFLLRLPKSIEDRVDEVLVTSSLMYSRN